MSKDLKKQSKFLSYVLRHKPEAIGIELDENGWVLVDRLIEASRAAGQDITQESLREVVETNDKKRFAFNETGDRIRASQGHSVKSVDLGLERIEPPEVLYHGTVEKFIAAIQEAGLVKMNRQHVHLSPTIETASAVGARRGKPVILEVQARKMHDDGFRFYLSANGVWLTDAVPWRYIDRHGS